MLERRKAEMERRKAERRRPLSMVENEVAGQFCRIPDGQRVFVESVRIAPGCGPTAIYRYIEGRQHGEIGICLPTNLEPLGKVISVG